MNLFSKEIPDKKQLITFLGVLFIILLCSLIVFFHFQIKLIRQNKYAEIRAVAQLKSSEIVRWFEERFSDADYFSRSPEIKSLILQLEQGREKANVKKDFDRIFTRMKQNHHYEEIMVTGKSGHIFYSFDPSHVSLDTSTLLTLQSVLKSGKMLMNDFHFRRNKNEVQLEIIAPVNLNNGDTAMLVFAVNPLVFLFPLIQSWPTPSKSSETMLVKREGDFVVYLNFLRHTPNVPLGLKISISNKTSPAVQAVWGQSGYFEGRDYNGVRVIADLSHIQGTSWYMVAKINKSEVFADLRFRIILLSCLSILILLLVSTSFAYLYNRRQKIVFEQLFLKEKELRLSQEEFRITLYSIGDAVITTDSFGNIRRMNMIAEKLTGWKEAEARDKKHDEIFHVIKEEHRDIVENPVKRVLEEGIVIDFTTHALLISKDDREIPVAYTWAPVRDQQNRITGVVLVFQDITVLRDAEKEILKLNAGLERRVEERTEQLKKINRELESFAYTVSHDLRTPLRAIDGFSAILSDDYENELDDEGKRIIQVIRQNAQKMGILIDELLTFSRLGRAHLKPSLISMKEMASAVFEELTLTGMKNEIDFGLGDLHPIHGDPSMIRQVWVNLISNAIKFTSQREAARITISSRQELNSIIYCIEDNGAGFDMKYYNKLFGVFQRLHSEKEFGGTGVGLAIIKQVILRHGGSVWAESKLNQGAAFYFSLPVQNNEPT